MQRQLTVSETFNASVRKKNKHYFENKEPSPHMQLKHLAHIGAAVEWMIHSSSSLPEYRPAAPAFAGGCFPVLSAPQAWGRQALRTRKKKTWKAKQLNLYLVLILQANRGDMVNQHSSNIHITVKAWFLSTVQHCDALWYCNWIKRRLSS